jgi:uncharacterized protein YraI
LFWKAWKDVSLDPQFPNPSCSAIIPLVGLGYRMEKPVTVSIATLNVRSGPGLNYQVVGTLKRGQVIRVRREVNTWGEIGRDQWIYLPYTVAAAQ